jgi:type II secretory pathway pseudopilin PulG
LIELLVVIAVLAVLAALLLPALAAGRNKSRATQCVGNLLQWGAAYRLYADDNNDYLPRRGQGVQELALIDRSDDWFNALPSYLGSRPFQDLVTNSNRPAAHAQSPFICPAATDPQKTYFLPYGMNMNLSPWNLPQPTKIRQRHFSRLRRRNGRCPRPLRFHLSLHQTLQHHSPPLQPP